MKRTSVITLVVLLALFAASTVALAQEQPVFKLGFKLLADQIPDIVGEPLENEHWGANGDSLQMTTKGLMAWRKADNWTAFTDGARTWINGPFGVQSRPNSERFEWEALPPQEFKGTGKAVSPRFDLQQGLTVFQMSHWNGRSNFAIWLLDSNGQRVDLLANEIGPYEGRVAIGIEKAGPYVMDIEADGEWTIVAEQPRVVDAPAIPQTFSGSGRSVSPFFALNPGLVSFEMQHSGRRNFAIWLMNSQGERQDLLVNVIGPFSGTKAIGVGPGLFDPKPGIHLLDIDADGDWIVTIR